MKIYWTPERIARLRELFPNPDVPWKALQAEFPERTQSDICKAARKFGIPKPAYRVGNRIVHPWEPWQKQFLIEHCHTMPAEDIAAAIGHPKKDVYSMICFLGLQQNHRPRRLSTTAIEGMERLHHLLSQEPMRICIQYLRPVEVVKDPDPAQFARPLVHCNLETGQVQRFSFGR